ncbi:lytic transglycosylase domain-containing protein [Candidatus Berkelbacteria bacterium]|nr:lytic transglycosylase domain-containing protein [Candidatus Berkelbacteria bacterium]
MSRRSLHRLIWLAFAGLALIILLLLPNIWADLVYPLKYETYILQAAAEFDLPPTLIAGVIYTESRFNEKATSHVGARGLMQIMPGTGAGIAQNLGEGDLYTADKLYDPAINIRYGSYYLRNLHDRYNNNLEAVLAAYNGGPGAAGNYLETGTAYLPRETIGFIGKVKAARDTYEQIYGVDLGSNITEQIQQPAERSLWDRVFGWLFRA